MQTTSAVQIKKLIVLVLLLWGFPIFSGEGTCLRAFSTRGKNGAS